MPGTFGDPVFALFAEPGVASASGIPTDGLAIRGATPAEAKVLVDGFEIPTVLHFGFRAVLSTLAIQDAPLTPGGFDVEHGRSTSGLLALTTRTHGEIIGAELSTLDGTVHESIPITDVVTYTTGLRFSDLQLWAPALAPGRTTVASGPRYFDGLVRVDRDANYTGLTGTIVFSNDLVELADPKRLTDEHTFVRAIATATSFKGPWEYEAALSSMLYARALTRGLAQHDRDDEWTLDAHATTTRRIGWVAGLRDFTVRFGADASFARHDLDVAMPEQPRENAPMVTELDGVDVRHQFAGVVSTHDAGVWGALQGGLSTTIVAKLGLRVDAFGSEVATQPRAELDVHVIQPVHVIVSAGAFRRPAEDREELEHPELHAERATQLSAAVVRIADVNSLLRGEVYYIDRTHLIERGNDDVLRNTGRGTSFGAELTYAKRRGPFSTRIAVGLAHSVRQDSPVTSERAAQYDQPVHVDGTVTWFRGAWSIGARVEVRSGLPVTPIQGAIYNSDRDRYEPLYGRLYSERAPYHAQLDLRIDRLWKWRGILVDAYLDIANVLDDRSAAGYVYNFDYMQKAALESLPILPMLGIRGTL